MLDYSSEFLSLLKADNIREALSNKDFKFLYKNIQSDLIPQFTYFCYDVLKIDPLEHMDYVPEYFSKELPITNFTIPDNVKSIQCKAFYDCNNMEEIEFGNGVTIIGDYAFDNCRALGYIEIPNNVNTIKDGAFFHCNALEEVVIPDTVTHLGPRVFEECTSLKTVKLGKGINRLEHSIFYHCTSLETVEMSNTITCIGSAIFAYCESLNKIKFDGTIKQWKAIIKEDSWDYSTNDLYIYCIDGMIKV